MEGLIHLPAEHRARRIERLTHLLHQGGLERPQRLIYLLAGRRICRVNHLISVACQRVSRGLDRAICLLLSDARDLLIDLRDHRLERARELLSQAPITALTMRKRLVAARGHTGSVSQ